MEQGFSASPVLEHVPSVKMHPHPAPRAAELGAKGLTDAAAVKPALTKDQQSIARVRGIQSRFMMPGQIELMGMLGGGVLGWAAKKLNWDRAGAVVGMTLKAPAKALRNTTLDSVLHLPANLMEAVAGEAEKGGVKTAGWAASAKENARLMHIDAGTLDGHVNELTKGVRSNVGAQITKFETTVVGEKLHGVLDGLLHKRQAVAATNHANYITKAQAALTEEKSGMLQSISSKIGKVFSRGKVTATAGMDELGAIVGKLEAGKGASHVMDISKELASLMEGDVLKGAAKGRAANIAKHLSKALGSAHALEMYKEAAGTNLKMALGAFGKALGKRSLFAALITVGATAGVTATLMTAHTESKEAKQALNDLTAELGNSDTVFLKAVKASHKGHKGSGLAKTGLQVVGDVADGLMWANPHGAGMAIMSAQMMPMICEQLVPGNAVLGAVMALKKEARGELQLKPEDRIEMWKALIGVRPEVAAHGGAYNRLAAADAAEIVERKLSVSEGLKLINDDAAFGQFSAEISAKRKAAEAATAAAIKEHTAAAPQQTVAINDDDKLAKAEAAYAAIEKPGHQIVANDNQLQGRLAGTELRRA